MKTIAEKMLQMRARLKDFGARLLHGATSVKDRTLDRLRYWRADRGADSPAHQEPKTARQRWRARHRLAYGVVRAVLLLVVVIILLPYVLVPLYRFVDPPASALMVRQVVRGKDVHQEWVDIEDISPHLVRAVLLAEDAAFCRHHGVDWNAIGEAIEDAEEGDIPRGASTIPMQTAKNLFLWSHQDYVRKALELPLAYYVSAVWPKRRVMEVYLNIAEWGPGIFGAEAAARYHFRKSAAALTPSEAALLAGALPNPIRRDAGRPGPRLQRLGAHIQGRVAREAQDAACVFD